MLGASNEVIIALKAKDEASKVIEGVTARAGRSFDQLRRRVGIAMTAIGGAIVGAAALSIKSFAQMGDEVQKMALRTGLSTEALSEWRHMADLGGTSLDTVEKAVKRMSSTLEDAKDGLLTATLSFDKLGIELEDLAGLSPEETFNVLCEAIAAIEDPLQRAALAQDMFGKSGTDLLPILDQGVEGMAEQREEAHRLGIVFDQEAADKAAGFNDALTRLKESVNGVKMAIAEHLVPVLTPLIDRITAAVAKVSKWASEHPKLSRAITVVVGALGGLMAILGPLLLMLPTLTAGWAALTGLLHTHTIAVIAKTVAVKAAAAAQWLWNAAMTANPIGLLVAAIGGLIVAIGAITGKLFDVTADTKAELEKQTALWKTEIGKQSQIATDAHNKRMGELYDELQLQLTQVDAETAARIAPILAQMELLEDLGKGEERLAQIAVDAAKWEALNQKLLAATTAEEIARINRELQDFIDQIGQEGFSDLMEYLHGRVEAERAAGETEKGVIQSAFEEEEKALKELKKQYDKLYPEAMAALEDYTDQQLKAIEDWDKIYGKFPGGAAVAFPHKWWTPESGLPEPPLAEKPEAVTALEEAIAAIGEGIPTEEQIRGLTAAIDALLAWLATREAAEVPKLQGGGLVTRGGLAEVHPGEVLPPAAARAGTGAGTTVNISVHVGAMMGNESDAREFARQLHRYLREETRTRAVGIRI